MCDCSVGGEGSGSYSTGMDITTPRNAMFSPYYKRSFAHYTMKNRVPIIITQSLDILVRNKDKIVAEYGKDAQEELKTVIGELSKLKYEVQTNKPLKNLTTTACDVKFYNDYLTQQATEYGVPTFFNTIFLHAECYTYRRIREIFEKTNPLQLFDPFRVQKEDAYNQCLAAVAQLGEYLLDLVHDPTVNQNTRVEFNKLLKLNLWGNKCDLSVTNGTVDCETVDWFSILDELDAYILSDQSEEVWAAVSDRTSESQIVDFIFDNSGLELFTDLCLADFIISKNLAQKIRFYVKTIPWFVSDVMTHDYHWLIEQLKSNSNGPLQELGERWQKYTEDNTWTIIEDAFWTLPVDFTFMVKVNPSLYNTLAEAKLIFFKGDLNYRKLFGEKNWDPTTPVNVALQGFHPSKLCTLRTIKCEVICGLKKGLYEEIEEKNEKWMTKGDYGIIQYSNTVNYIKQ